MFGTNKLLSRRAETKFSRLLSLDIYSNIKLCKYYKMISTEFITLLYRFSVITDCFGDRPICDITYSMEAYSGLEHFSRKQSSVLKCLNCHHVSSVGNSLVNTK